MKTQIEGAYISEGFLYIEYDGFIQVYATEDEYIKWVAYALDDEIDIDDPAYYWIGVAWYKKEYFRMFVEYTLGRCLHHWHHDCTKCEQFFSLTKPF